MSGTVATSPAPHSTGPVTGYLDVLGLSMTQSESTAFRLAMTRIAQNARPDSERTVVVYTDLVGRADGDKYRQTQN